jgi:hypothetical protein
MQAGTTEGASYEESRFIVGFGGWDGYLSNGR